MTPTPYTRWREYNSRTVYRRYTTGLNIVVGVMRACVFFHIMGVAYYNSPKIARNHIFTWLLQSVKLVERLSSIHEVPGSSPGCQRAILTFSWLSSVLTGNVLKQVKASSISISSISPHIMTLDSLNSNAVSFNAVWNKLSLTSSIYARMTTHMNPMTAMDQSTVTPAFLSCIDE
jgi:hypothetical protein